MSRQARSRPTSSGTVASAWPRAASAARCTNTGAQEVLNSISLASSAAKPGGATIQPRRQPVIRKLFEKLCTTSSRSSGSAMSRKLGAQAPAAPAKKTRS